MSVPSRGFEETCISKASDGNVESLCLFGRRVFAGSRPVAITRGVLALSHPRAGDVAAGPWTQGRQRTGLHTAHLALGIIYDPKYGTSITNTRVLPLLVAIGKRITPVEVTP